MARDYINERRPYGRWTFETYSRRHKIMAASSTLGPEVTFFGTNPTAWESLTRDQKDSYIASTQLPGRMEGYYAWAPAGDLARQWRQKGFDEFATVIEESKHLGNGSNFLRREKLVSHELYLLSHEHSRETAVPFIVITSRNLKQAQETVSRLRKHPRLSRFNIKYLARKEGLAGD